MVFVDDRVKIKGISDDRPYRVLQIKGDSVVCFCEDFDNPTTRTVDISEVEVVDDNKYYRSDIIYG